MPARPRVELVFGEQGVCLRIRGLPQVIGERIEGFVVPSSPSHIWVPTMIVGDYCITAWFLMRMPFGVWEFVDGTLVDVSPQYVARVQHARQR